MEFAESEARVPMVGISVRTRQTISAVAHSRTAPDVDRLFSIHHEIGLDEIEAALAALGWRLVVSIETA
jgi:hypothetical protein